MFWVWMWTPFHGWRQMLAATSRGKADQVARALKDWFTGYPRTVLVLGESYRFAGIYGVETPYRGQTYSWGRSPEWQNAIDVATALQVLLGYRFTLKVKPPTGAAIPVLEARSHAA